MPKSIPVSGVEDFGKKFGCLQVIVFAHDGEREHCVTWGVNAEHCAQAASGGNRLKKHLGWPAGTLAEPTVVRGLRKQVAQLRRELDEAKRSLSRMDDDDEGGGPGDE